jgi:hypothetical protein
VVVLVDQDKVIQRQLADLEAEEMVETILKEMVETEQTVLVVEAVVQMVMAEMALLF